MVSMDMQEIADGSSCWENGQLKSVRVNAGYGSGCLSRVRSLQSGISAVIQDFSLYGDGKIRLTRETAELPFIGFGSFFSGVEHISYTKPRIPLGIGFSNIVFAEYEPALYMEIKANTPVRVFIVCIDPTHFENLTGKSSNDLVGALDVLDYNIGRKGKPARSKPLDYAQKICTCQAISAFTEAPDDSLLLEAKAMELVALQLKQLDYLSGLPQKKTIAPDIQKISYACEILKNEMAVPPGGRELARRVGLNYNQLIRGFKEALGILPFEYLRTVRLEKAYNLIAGRDCNITEAAFSVGYASLSHFTKSFRKEFGMNPKTHARESTRLSVPVNRKNPSQGGRGSG